MAFSDAVVRCRKGDRRALVITPTAHRRLGLERLQELRETADESPIETGLVDRVRTSSSPYPIVIFRGRNDDGTATWGFDEGLGPEDALALARMLVISHLPTHRCLLTHGSYVMVHTDFGSREADLLRRASKELLEERREVVPSDADLRAIYDADLWILRHLNFYFSLGFERVVEGVLPDKIPLIETRSRNIEALAAALRGPVGQDHG